MASNFDEMIDRRNTASLKWDVEENELPMWVADMDFATAPCVLEAMKKRLNHGIFGYTVIPEQWYEAYVGWWKKDIILKWKRIGLFSALVWCLPFLLLSGN